MFSCYAISAGLDVIYTSSKLYLEVTVRKRGTEDEFCVKEDRHEKFCFQRSHVIAD